MKIYLARHAERDDFKDVGAWSHAWWQAHADGRPWDPPLSEQGHEQAHELGALLEAKLAAAGIASTARVVVVTSPFVRCFQTGTAVCACLVEAGRRLGFSVDAGLCEHLRADWFDAATGARPDFMLPAEALATAASPSPAAIATTAEPALAPATYPEGEAELDERARCVAASLLSMAGSAEAPAAVILVTHGGVLARIVAAVAHACTAVDDTPAMPHQGYAALTTLTVDVQSAVPAGGSATFVCDAMAELPVRLTPDQLWFAGQEPVWRSVLIPHIAARKSESAGQMSVLELGSWEGASAVWLLTNCCEASSQSRLTCVDHFDKLQTPASARRASKFAYNTRITALWPRVNLVVDFTVTALSRLLAARREWDLVYIDASHEAADTLLDAMLAWKGVRRGGLVVFDDYLWPQHSETSPLHPKPGIDAFLQLHAHELEILHKGYQVIVKKTVPPRFNF